jgi:hypothetical protein
MLRRQRGKRKRDFLIGFVKSQIMMAMISAGRRMKIKLINWVCGTDVCGLEEKFFADFKM